MSPSSPHLLAARHVLNFRSVRKRERERECIGFGTNGDWEGESVWKRQWLWVCVCVCGCACVCVRVCLPRCGFWLSRSHYLGKETERIKWGIWFELLLPRICYIASNLKENSKNAFLPFSRFKKLIYFLTKYSYQTWWPSSEARLPEKPKNPSARAIDISLLC